MGRKQKHPEHVQRAQELMNALLDEDSYLEAKKDR